VYYRSQVIASLVPYQKPMLKGWPWNQSLKYCICEVQNMHIGFSRTHRNSLLSFCKTPCYSMKLSRIITDNFSRNWEKIARHHLAFVNIWRFQKLDSAKLIVQSQFNSFQSLGRPGFLTFPIENCKLILYKWYITELGLWLRENSCLF